MVKIQAVIIYKHFHFIKTSRKELQLYYIIYVALSLLPRLGRSPGEGYGNPLQYSCLGRGAWRATQPGVTQSRTEATEHAHHLLLRSLYMLSAPME